MPARAVRVVSGAVAVSLIAVGLFMAMAEAGDVLVAVLMGAGILFGIIAAMMRSR